MPRIEGHIQFAAARSPRYETMVFNSDQSTGATLNLNWCALLGVERAVLLFTLCSLLFSDSASGNPIFVDEQIWSKGQQAWEQARQNAMSSEDVRVTVGRDESVVSGHYTFRGPLMRALSNYEIYVPVLLPQVSAGKYDASGGSPILSLGRRKILMQKVAAKPGFPSVRLPAEWKMVWYAAYIPRNEVRREVKALITYTQPNFSDGSVGYVPLNPPESTGSSSVVFVGKDGLLLRPFSPLSFLHSGKPQLHFTPRHRKLLRVTHLRPIAR